MKFIVQSTVLLKQLQSISGVLNSNNSLPILDNFLFELEEDSLSVSASDLETTMTTKMEIALAEEPGTVAIPAKILLETLKTFPDIPVTFTIDKENFSIELSAGEGKYKLAGHDADEFPRIPELESAATLELPCSVLATGIVKTIFATANDELRPQMSGVYFQLSPDGLTFVATDAHKLVRYTRKDATSEEEASFIMPKKPLNQLKSTLGNSDNNCIIEYNETNALFTFNNIKLVCRLIEGKYPNYEAVIPKSNPNKLTIQRNPFLSAIKRVSIFSSQSTHQVKFKLTGQELMLSAEDLDFANEAKERLTCQYEGTDMEIGFNSKFMLEMLQNIDTEEIDLEMSAPNKAGLLYPVYTEPKEEDVLMLVMPVMLNN